MSSGLFLGKITPGGILRATDMAPDPILRVKIKLAARGWVPICYDNALRLSRDICYEVQMMTFRRRVWESFVAGRLVRCKYRARQVV